MVFLHRIFPSRKYRPVIESDSDDDSAELNLRRCECCGHGLQKETGSQGRKSRRPPPTLKILFATNLVVLIGVFAYLSRLSSDSNFSLNGYKPPYTPAAEAISWVSTKFKPMLIFQTNTNDEVEEAWQKSMGPLDGAIQVPYSEISKIGYESVENPYMPGYHIYGIAMFHQLHCLNVIRQSFWREKFFAHNTTEEFEHHRNHCFDYLRQSIMCHGDVGVTYWWNETYGAMRPDGFHDYSPVYKNMSIEERAKNSYLKWDYEHQCHDYNKIEEWVREHNAVVPPEGEELSQHTQDKIHMM